MIDKAAWKPTKSAGAYNADATLHRPRIAEDVETAELAAAARSVVRMVLGRHSCPRLAACPQHGQDLCDCTPCTHPDHAADAADARDALLAFGMASSAPLTHRTCCTCHRSKPLSRFSKKNLTRKECLSEKKAEREAGLADG
ncbi:hypothetical protein [Nonomuraea rubra]|uniref:Uncharacterized protein n=1 Tax=Nonomuraea rubra TaxID=46180 RepID=A0A7X0P6Z8_9ACTN|nr:hypothetical protein [Nonomuraea rubra]MBB6556221.1 hypothetical protein [Nonomuraea rubra]